MLGFTQARFHFILLSLCHWERQRRYSDPSKLRILPTLIYEEYLLQTFDISSFHQYRSAETLRQGSVVCGTITAISPFFIQKSYTVHSVLVFHLQCLVLPGIVLLSFRLSSQSSPHRECHHTPYQIVWAMSAVQYQARKTRLRK